MPSKFDVFQVQCRPSSINALSILQHPDSFRQLVCRVGSGRAVLEEAIVGCRTIGTARRSQIGAECNGDTDAIVGVDIVLGTGVHAGVKRVGDNGCEVCYLWVRLGVVGP